MEIKRLRLLTGLALLPVRMLSFMHVCQLLVAGAMAVNEAFVVKSEQVQKRRAVVGARDRVFHHTVSR